jgi:hypothetical protein
MDLFRERASAADVLLLGVREGGGLTNFDRKTARDTFFEQDEKWNYIHHKVYEDSFLRDTGLGLLLRSFAFINTYLMESSDCLSYVGSWER